MPTISADDTCKDLGIVDEYSCGLHSWAKEKCPDICGGKLEVCDTIFVNAYSSDMLYIH